MPTPTPIPIPMIKQYLLHNFKNHADTKLNLSALTLLTGMNGAGKSSIMQSMLLLRDSFIRNDHVFKLYLNGDSFSVGNIGDAINWHCKEDNHTLGYGFVLDNEEKYELFYHYPSDVEASEIKIDKDRSTANLEYFLTISLFSDKFQYLSAFRNGPRPIYNSDKEIVDSRRQLSQHMGRGEMTVYFLNKFGNEPLPIDDLCYDREGAHTLRHQVTCWMNEISNGIQMQINQSGSSYEIRFGTEKKGSAPIYHSALNTGYGISYVLSVVVAILSAKPGSLILIENPEAHIHPAGQSAMMRLISKAANAGVQVIIETHSDHVINGALVARKQRLLSEDALTVYFFDIDENLNASPQKLEIGKNGLIQHAPERFFGQMNTDLKILFDLN